MFEYWLKTDIRSMPEICRISGRVFTQDDRANKIGAAVTNAGDPVELTGEVTANIIRADGETITATGEMEGNRAWVVLPSAAYDIPGTIRIFLKVTDGETVTTIGAAEGNVYQSMTGR